MRGLACVFVFVGACGGSNTAAQPPIGNHEAPDRPPACATQLPPKPTRDELSRALKSLDERLAPEQQALADAASEEDKQIAHARLQHCVDERRKILTIYNEMYNTPCDPRDPLCAR